MLLLVFGSAKLLSEVCERFGIPGLIGEICAGVIVGPGLLNWVQPGQVLTALAELGVMFLLFRVGLEVDVAQLFQVGRTALMVAVAGVALPFVAGWLLFLLVGVSHVEAIFVGAALVATSVGITAQVLATKGLLNERASRTILAAAVIDDILGLLVLAVVSSFAENSVNILGLASTALMAIAFTFLVAKFGAGTVKRMLPRVEKTLATQEAQFQLALVLLFALSLLAVYIGVAAIVGAFLAGLAFSEAASTRVKDLTHGITELLLPFFFAGIGLQLNLASFKNPQLVFLALGLTLVAVATKFIGCGLPALSLGRTDAVRVGVGMVPRGEVGMIVAQIGMSLGVIHPDVYAVVVFMAVATTLVAPPLLNIAFRDCVPSAATEQFNLG
jgi:Kef-type K+ transport system membrane component KefB